MLRNSKERTQGAKRSPKWGALRRKFLAGKKCAFCGGTKKLEAHHINPFHLHPELELDEQNLIALCEGNKDVNCHLVMGHYFNFKLFNCDVENDCKRYSSDREFSKR